MIKIQNFQKCIWLLSITLLLLLLFFSFDNISKTVSAHDSCARVKLVTSIEVKKGDTLWSIASNYYSHEYVDMNDYIREIKKSNSLHDDMIHVGNYIIVPYYSD